MPASVSPDPFIIRPDDNLLEQRPALRRAARDLAQVFAGVYAVPVEQQKRRKIVASDEMLQAVGGALWQVLDLDEALVQARAAAGAQIVPIVIESDSAEIQQLPWETLHHPDFGFLGLHPAFTLSRRVPAMDAALPDLRPGPLRVLLFTALPDDLDAEKERLDIEEDQAQVLEALTPLIAEGVVVLEMPDDGRFATLKQFLKKFEPHLVFISGHGKYIHAPHRDEAPFAIFLCEDDHGGSDPIHEKRLAQAFIGSGAGCVVLSACESGMTASDALTTGLIWSLRSAGVPHVVGMRESVLDRAGTLFARAFGDALARRERLDVALQAGRQAITTPLQESPWLATDGGGLAEQSLGQWSLPLLLSQQVAQPLLQWDFTPQPPPEPVISETLETVTLPPRFIGRRSELRALKGRLRRGELRQLLITGPGGQGKTALAGKIALDLQRRGYAVFAYAARPENIWQEFFIGLMRALDPAGRADFASMEPYLPDEQARANHMLALLLKQHRGRVVLFFDNLESLQDGETQALTDERLAAWIAAAQGLAKRGLVLLLTSRWRLPGWPEADLWPLHRANYGDFLQMARPLLPLSFLSNRNRLRQVYAVLDGNGRGLIFFAAAVKEMGADDEDAFLAALARAENETQTDLALATIVVHLDDDARALLQRLPVYRAPAPLEGVVKIALDLPDPAAHLQRLLAVSLVVPTAAPRWQTVEYQLSPLVADWLAKQDDAVPPAPETWRQAARYWQYLYRWERPTLAQAVITHRALRDAGEADAAHRLALDDIVGPLSRQGLYRTLLAEWLPAICEAEDDKIRGEALGLTGKQAYHLGNFSAALDLFRQSLKIWQEIGDKAGEGTTLNNISQIFKARGDYETALGYLEQSLKISQEIGDKAGEGTTLNNISGIYRARGDYETALGYLEQSLKISQEIGDKAGEGTTLNNISQIYDARGDYETALGYLEQSLKIRQEIGDKAGEGTTLNNISQIFKARGDYETALGYLEQSLKIWQEIGDKAGEGTTLNNISQIYDARGDYETALGYLEQSLKIRQEIGDKAGEGTTLNNISGIYRARGDYETALGYLEQSLKISQEIGDKAGEGTTLNNMATTAYARGDYETALGYLEQSLKIRQEIGDKAGEGTTLNNISQIFKARGDYETALGYLEQSLKIWQEIGDKAGEGTTLNNISQIYDARGDYETALGYLEQSLKISQEIGDVAGLCATLFNMGHMHWQNDEQGEALGAWVTVYQLAQPRGLAQVLQALANLAGQLGLEGGLAGWAALASQADQE